jgi:hypothetical protein
MADFSHSNLSIGALDEKIRHVEVHNDEDLVNAAKLGRDLGFKAADLVDMVGDAVEDALEDHDRMRKTRFGVARSRSVVRMVRIYAAGLRQADRVFRSMVTTYEKKYAEERAANRKKDRKPHFTPGG